MIAEEACALVHDNVMTMNAGRDRFSVLTKCRWSRKYRSCRTTNKSESGSQSAGCVECECQMLQVAKYEVPPEVHPSIKRRRSG